MVIRRLTEDDLDALWALRLEALWLSPEAFGTTYDEALAQGNDELRERLRDGGDGVFYLGAFDDEQGRLCGMVRFTRDGGLKDRHKGEVASLFVLPEQRARGVGRTLMLELIARAKRLEGLEQLLLAVVASNGAARGLYESLGFTRYGTTPHALKDGGTYWDEELMVLFLA